MFHVHEQGSTQPGPSDAENPLRLKEMHFISTIPFHPGQKQRKRKKCVRCNAMGKRCDSSYECKKCGVGLCLDECFEIYHTKKNFARNYYPIPPSSTEEETTESESDY